MSKVFLGDIAKERRETCKGSKNEYPIVGLEHLTPEEITLSAWEEGKDNTFTKLFYKGDILFGRRRAYLKKAAIAPFDGICSGDITVIQAMPEKILPELLPFIIQNDVLFDFAVGKSAGSLSPRVKWEHLKNYEFELPGLDKQLELAKVLWAMDATKKSYQNLLLKTDELVKAQFIEMFGDVKSNPKQLKVCPLGDVCIVERGGSPRPIAKYITDSPLGINWIKIGDADESRYITRTEEKIIPEGLRKTRRVKAGDLILSNSMSFGHPYILKIDGCIHDGWLVLHFEESVFDAIYLQTYLGLPATYALFASVAAGGVVNNLNSELVRKLPVLIPSIDTQKEFAAFVRQSDKSKSELEQALVELTAISSTLRMPAMKQISMRMLKLPLLVVTSST